MESTTQVHGATEEKPAPGGAAKLIRRVKRATRRTFSAEEKIRIVLEAFRKEIPVVELCRRREDQPCSVLCMAETVHGGREGSSQGRYLTECDP